MTCKNDAETLGKDPVYNIHINQYLNRDTQSALSAPILLIAGKLPVWQAKCCSPPLSQRALTSRSESAGAQVV